MEKTLTIDGKQVAFKTTGATPLRYKQQFGVDFFSSLQKMIPSGKKQNDIDLELFFNFAWVAAKTADKSIPSPMEWFDSFDEFPILDLVPELQDLLLATMQTKKK